MRTIVIGLGVQGYKRSRFAGDDFVASVDIRNPEAHFRVLTDVPVSDYDAALVCTPDEVKLELLEYLLGHGKHVLVEKPLTADDTAIARLEKLSFDNKAICYVGYNHRFEPHFVRMRDFVVSGKLGRIYRCRMFYGNGTARLVRESEWRDQGNGVLDDLGSHLLDTAHFWFAEIGEDFHIVSSDRFENRAPDHVVFVSGGAHPRLEFEMTLLSWRNHFTADVFGEHGSAHIRSLCKWGPSEFIHYTRVLPSGRPLEDTQVLTQEDPTWALEYAHFKALCADRRPSSLANDLWLNRVLRKLGSET